ncbi:hypothetical protein H6P81_002437 [Aristolochia fimbriata]|uniref:RNA methyltransferase n=1 Tax=Aristolochia fimbriata TaxID=158543 RepID=A0AAV7FBJ1_ARIFI|nr:hypothetical protein H6P81_002437 [Aristolochia fimbriata]
MGKKRREAENEQEVMNGGVVDGEKKKKRKEKKCEKPTVSIAVAGSIIDNAQSYELATRLAGQIARAATIFRIDEVVVFDSQGSSSENSSVTKAEDIDGNGSGATFLVRILKYLETPQYLRRSLFPKHNDLRFVGLLPPLDAPHHLRKHEWAPYREGITLNERPSNSTGTVVDVGLSKNVAVEPVMESGVRVTVAMGTERHLESDPVLKVVSSVEPKEKGLYWGYKVRYAPNISSVFKECPYEGGYDHSFGTSEHGIIIDSSELMMPTFRHLLIAFGGLAGLEENFEEDSNFKGKDVRDVFSSYMNTCPHQGSRTIRTEEAIFISLQYFQGPIKRALQ